MTESTPDQTLTETKRLINQLRRDIRDIPADPVEVNDVNRW